MKLSQMTTAQTLWAATLNRLALKMTRSTFDTWFKQTNGLIYQDDYLTVQVHSLYAKDWLENRLRGIIEQTLLDVASKPVHVAFVVADDIAS